MRTLLVSPFPRWYLLVAKLLAGVAVSIAQVYVFLGIAWFWGVKAPPIGYLFALPALFLSGMMLCALGLLLSSMIRQHEEFRRHHELRDLPDVFRLARTLPAVAHPGIRAHSCTRFASPTRSPMWSN